MLDSPTPAASSNLPQPKQRPVRKSDFKLSQKNNAADLQESFDQKGRIHIQNFFHDEIADQIALALENSTRWNIVTNNNGRHLDLDAKGMARLSSQDQTRFFDAIHEQARWKFQYLFGNYPIYDSYYSGRLGKGTLHSLFEFLNSPIFLDFVRKVTGDDTIKFADAQATKYEAGHFLTVHDDDIDGKQRCCAYVLNFTREWRADWGGLLQFYGADNHIEQAYMPRFNALNIFRIPKKHSVSVVAPFADAARYSITGWLRSGADPNREKGKRVKI